ncbi:MAG: hypothetical protein HOL85_08945 [Rhodospirillaceae bacterium]|jgi:hypothetical protein|nr:hypothetical protein [Rhodospirillaceae bacterium]MBT6138656.1 hypothetical protein [Rhodospirillaceae bacterium]
MTGRTKLATNLGTNLAAMVLAASMMTALPSYAAETSIHVLPKIDAKLCGSGGKTGWIETELVLDFERKVSTLYLAERMPGIIRTVRGYMKQRTLDDLATGNASARFLEALRRKLSPVVAPAKLQAVDMQESGAGEQACG